MKKNIENDLIYKKDKEGKKQVPMQTIPHFKKKHYTNGIPVLFFSPNALFFHEEGAIFLGWV